MTGEIIIAALKWSVLVIGPIAALISLTRKSNVEGPDGARRLTLEGRILFGVTAFSGIVSLISTGFEQIAEQNKQQKDLIEKNAAERRLAEDKVKKREERRERQAKEDATARDLQTRLLRQSLKMAQFNAAEQARDAALSRTVSIEANNRLKEANRTLAELERVTYPLRTVSAIVEISYPVPENTGSFWKEMDELGDDPYQQRKPEQAREIVRDPPFFNKYPALDPPPAGGYISLLLHEPDDRTGVASPSGPPLIHIRLDGSRVHVNRHARTIRLTLYGAYEPQREGELSHKRFSVNDVRKLIPELSLMRGGFRLRNVGVAINGVYYFGTGEIDEPIDQRSERAIPVLE